MISTLKVRLEMVSSNELYFEINFISSRLPVISVLHCINKLATIYTVLFYGGILLLGDKVPNS